MHTKASVDDMLKCTRNPPGYGRNADRLERDTTSLVLDRPQSRVKLKPSIIPMLQYQHYGVLLADEYPQLRDIPRWAY